MQRGRLVILLAAAGAIAAAAAGFYWLQGTPEYSLYQIKRAMKRHDLAAFLARVDVEAIHQGSLIPFEKWRDRQLAQQVAVVGPGGESLFPGVGRPTLAPGQSVAIVAHPELEARLRSMAAEAEQRMRKEWQEAADSNRKSLLDVAKIVVEKAMLGGVSVDAVKVLELKREGNVADATLGRADGQAFPVGSARIRLRLQAAEGRKWKVVAFSVESANR